MYPTRIIKISTGFGRTISLNLINRFLLIVILCEYTDLDGEISRTPRPPNPLTNRAAYDGPKKKKNTKWLTVLLSKPLTLHVKYADLPSNAVTFLGVSGSNCGPTNGLLSSGLTAFTSRPLPPPDPFLSPPPLLWYEHPGDGQTERKKTIISVFPPLIVLGKIMLF